MSYINVPNVRPYHIQGYQSGDTILVDMYECGMPNDKCDGNCIQNYGNPDSPKFEVCQYLMCHREVGNLEDMFDGDIRIENDEAVLVTYDGCVYICKKIDYYVLGDGIIEARLFLTNGVVVEVKYNDIDKKLYKDISKHIDSKLRQDGFDSIDDFIKAMSSKTPVDKYNMFG